MNDYEYFLLYSLLDLNVAGLEIIVKKCRSLQKIRNFRAH